MADAAKLGDRVVAMDTHIVLVHPQEDPSPGALGAYVTLHVDFA